MPIQVESKIEAPSGLVLFGGKEAVLGRLLTLVVSRIQETKREKQVCGIDSRDIELLHEMDRDLREMKSLPQWTQRKFVSFLYAWQIELDEILDVEVSRKQLNGHAEEVKDWHREKFIALAQLFAPE